MRQSARSALWRLLVALAAAGCTGDIGAPTPAATDDAPPGPGPVVRPPPGATPAMPPGAGRPVDAPSACLAIEPGPPVLRRLTRAEYLETVRDLLGSEVVPADIVGEFPPEPRPLGFDNGAGVTGLAPTLIEAHAIAAERLARAVAGAGLDQRLGCRPTETSEEACARDFFARIGGRAYRRPLETADLDELVNAYRIGRTGGDLADGIRTGLTFLLQAPSFLYRLERGKPVSGNDGLVALDAWELGARLSYLLWRSPPDAGLMAAIEANRLSSSADLRRLAEGMMADPRARATLAYFNDQWLSLDRIAKVTKDTKVFAGFDGAIAGAMQESSRRYVDATLWEGTGTLTELLTAPFTYVTPSLSRFWGMEGGAGAAPARVSFDGRERAGLLSQGGLMAALAKENQSDPIVRGKFVREHLLCDILSPPPDDVPIAVPPPSDTLTARERFTQHRDAPACAGCHRYLDPIGLALETFDGVGRFRRTENGTTIDTTGEVVGVENGKFDGVVELGALLARSDKAQTCVVQQWFRYAYGRLEEEGRDDCTLAFLRERFRKSGFRIKDLIVALTETDTFRYRRSTDPGTGGKP